MFLLIFGALPSFGFHIVGGEIEFLTMGDGQYEIRVIQYFDRDQTQNPQPEEFVEVFIFRNIDGAFMSSHVLQLDNEFLVEYTNSECSWEELITSRVVWKGTIDLVPQDYDDAVGYAIIWERCCRNDGVKNIENPSGTGMKYVSEIPPLWSNGKVFINSSPQLFAPLGDYACINQLYYAEFTGSDPDGDSLVYSLTTPLNSSSAIALPIPQPAPHPLVFFKSGYDLNNMISGNPALTISSRGLLTVKPSEAGLFVFSVLVEEFRQGVKIGQVQRDYQLLVRDDGCDPPDPPIVGVKIPGNDSFVPESDILYYSLSDDKCFDFIVKNITPGETILLRAEGVNFEGDISEIFDVTVFENVLSDLLTVQVCAPGCPPIGEGVFIIDLIAGDNSCPLPQLDTMRLSIQVEPPPNSIPTVTSNYVSSILEEGVRVEFPIRAIDVDLDELSVSYYIPDVLDPSQFGFSISQIVTTPGSLEAVLVWDTDCQLYDFSEKQFFEVYVVVEDADVCQVQNSNFILFDLQVNLPANTLPNLSVPSYPSHELTIEPDEVLNFEVLASDADGDLLDLSMGGIGFNPYAFGASFEPNSSGLARGSFSWQANCAYLSNSGSDQFTFFFLAEDADKCNLTNKDTLLFIVNVSEPINTAPVIDLVAPIQLEVNQAFSLNLSAYDLDGDIISLGFAEEFRRPQSPSLRFDTQTGEGSVSATLFWQPECNLLRNSTSANYDLIFITRDDHCPLSAYDTTRIRFEVIETRNNFENFLPPNAFSPNGDEINDFFSLVNNEDPSHNLPADNCDDEFEYISIYDRAGARAFFSKNREFVWNGTGVAPGIYYYLIKYSKTDYKGYLQVIK